MRVCGGAYCAGVCRRAILHYTGLYHGLIYGDYIQGLYAAHPLAQGCCLHPRPPGGWQGVNSSLAACTSLTREVCMACTKFLALRRPLALHILCISLVALCAALHAIYFCTL